MSAMAGCALGTGASPTTNSVRKSNGTRVPGRSTLPPARTGPAPASKTSCPPPSWTIAACSGNTPGPERRMSACGALPITMRCLPKPGIIEYLRKREGKSSEQPPERDGPEDHGAQNGADDEEGSPAGQARRRQRRAPARRVELDARRAIAHGGEQLAAVHERRRGVPRHLVGDRCALAGVARHHHR